MTRLSVRTQLRLAALDAPFAYLRLHARSALWFAAYLSAASIVLGLVATLVAAHRSDIVSGLSAYVLPASWQFAGRLLVENFFASQERVVVINAAITASLLVVQATLFPLKEKVSLALERDAGLVDQPIVEHPLWFQALEEVKLTGAVLAAQASIFWIGYSDEPARRTLASVLSFVVVFASLGVDFLSPVLQRHKLRYSQILKTLLAHPVLLFGFGAIFSLPPFLAAAFAGKHPEWSFGMQVGVTFAGAILGVALAAIGGTVAAAPLVEHAQARRPSPLAVRLLAWAVLLGVAGWNVQRIAVLGRSLHHKTQILKCDYTVDWSSFSADLPSEADLLLAATTKLITVAATFVVVVKNDTGVDVEIERNRLELRHEGQRVATTSLPEGRIASGATERITVRIPLTLSVDQVLRLRELATKKGWTLTLFLRVTEDLEFPIFLVSAP